MWPFTLNQKKASTGRCELVILYITLSCQLGGKRSDQYLLNTGYSTSSVPLICVATQSKTIKMLPLRNHFKVNNLLYKSRITLDFNADFNYQKLGIKHPGVYVSCFGSKITYETVWYWWGKGKHKTFM